MIEGSKALVLAVALVEIGPDSWRWRKDRSWDGGESWLEGVGFIEAVRAEAASPAGG